MPHLSPLLRRSCRLLHRHPPGLLGVPHLLQQTATFVDAKVKWVRDRGLDHAVEKEKHLRPLHSLKNLLFLQSSPISVPLSAIAERRDDLGLPFRALRFIRKYPAFIEDSHSSAIRPTKELIRLHEEEISIYKSCRAESADRLLRLLMLTRRKRLPLAVLDRLGWDLGLPRDYTYSLLPDYPDYFEIVPALDADASRRGHLDLALVCWRKDLAVSAMEQAALRTRGEHRSGMPLAFSLNFPRGFDLDKKVKKWTEDLQKLPYISPYEDGTVLDQSTAVAEKWMVGVLHELLHLLVSKKTEKENLLILGEHAGLLHGFKKVLVRYPGIFYISNKNRTQTVVLRESFKRDRLLDKHPLMGMRYQYISLMRKGSKEGAVAGGCREKGIENLGMETYNINNEGCEEVGAVNEEEDGEEFSETSDFDSEVESDDGLNEKDYDGDERISRSGTQLIR